MADQTTTIFKAALDAGLDKNGVIMKLVTEGGMEVVEAVREYQKLAKAEGIVLGAKERFQRVAAMLDDVDVSDHKVRGEMVTRIADEFDVSEATAAADIRKYAEDKGIELPSSHRNSLEDLVQFVKDGFDAGKDRDQIKEDLQNEMGYTANSAASALSRATKELGMSTGRTGASVPIDQVVAFVRANEHMDRKPLSQKMAEELGYSEVTAYAYLTYLNFAKEYARQELEEYKNTAQAA